MKFKFTNKQKPNKRKTNKLIRSNQRLTFIIMNKNKIKRNYANKQKSNNLQTNMVKQKTHRNEQKILQAF